MTGLLKVRVTPRELRRLIDDSVREAVLGESQKVDAGYQDINRIFKRARKACAAADLVSEAARIGKADRETLWNALISANVDLGSIRDDLEEILHSSHYAAPHEWDDDYDDEDEAA